MAGLNMMIAGFGGQGILFTGKIVAYAGLIDNKEVSWLPSYGPEMRGGTANCSVCIADEPIGSPLITQPDILVGMNAPSFDKFIGTVTPGGTVLVDSTLVTRTTDRKDITIYAVPATRLSSEHHLPNLSNMILLGKLLKETAFSSLATVQKAVTKCVPSSKQHLLEPNLQAIQMGMAL